MAVTAATLLILQAMAPGVFAQMTHYTDVQSGVYYEEAASALLDLGALDANETRLRPSDLATRAEMMKLMVNLRDEPLAYPATASFTDVGRSTWYFPYVEAAAKAGWVKGDRNCYGQRPCTARPGDPVNRAEAAALLVRVFALQKTNAAPDFSDVGSAQWYADPIQAAADHCVLQGDSGTTRVRPGAFMNRAEMVVMFHRASQSMQYGSDCGTAAAEINSIVAVSPRMLRVNFSENVNTARAENTANYTVVRSSGTNGVAIRSADLTSARTVELELASDIAENTSYQLVVRNLMTQGGASFTDSETFELEGAEGSIRSVTALSANRVRVVFDTNVDENRAEDEVRYVLERSGGGGTIGVQSAILIDDRTAELTLASNMTAGVSYRLDAQSMQTSGGSIFSGTFIFSSPPATGAKITSVSATSSTRLRVDFDTPLDRTRSQDVSRYTVNNGNRNLPLIAAYNLADDRSVEIVVGESLQAQRSYTVTARDLLTQQGAIFTASGSVTYSPSSTNFTALLMGAKETPAVVTNASGTGTFVLTTNGLQYDITVRNMSGASITGAHFHQGASTVAGPVLMPITFTGTRATGTWNLTNNQRNALLDGNIYVNIHTTQYPNGEIRSQVQAQ